MKKSSSFPSTACVRTVLECGNPFVKELMETSSYTLNGHSVLPTVTLPCHTSMFYGVPPKRHGILTNTYTLPSVPFPESRNSFPPLERSARPSITGNPSATSGRQNV